MALDMTTPILVFYIALWVLGAVLSCLLTFVVIRTAILGALKAHSRWVRDGMP